MNPAVRLLLFGGRFNPLSLFAAGEQGAWFDPSDLSSMFQDSAGTTPVTATGQPVGMIKDKSGRGNHAAQATAASRPTLQQDASGFYYLALDGVDDSLTLAAINFTATDKMTVCVGVYKEASALASAIWDGSPNVNVGSAGLSADTTANSYSAFTRGDTSLSGIRTPATFTAPIGNVVTSLHDISGALNTDENKIRVNGVLQAPTSVNGGPAGGGNFGTWPYNIGQRAGGSLRLSGRIYGLLVRGALSSASEIAQTERYIGAKMGVSP